MHDGPLTDGRGLIALDAGRATVEVAPGIGGSIASFRWTEGERQFDWLRSATADTLARADAFGMGCFPLVPYSNRIRDGGFDFAGRRITLPATPDIDPHYEHGHGWRRPWEVDDFSRCSVTLQLDHPADAWPWHYRACQGMWLDDGGALHITLAVSNLDTDPMPVGLGLHPYFPKTKGTRLTTRVERMWAIDREVLPTDLRTLHDTADPSRGMTVAATDLDNVFTGWDGRAEILWPESCARLRLEVEGPLEFLVLYTPRAEPYFCAEPVSNATDAFNLAASGLTDTGMIVLEPGKSVKATFRFIPELLN